MNEPEPTSIDPAAQAHDDLITAYQQAQDTLVQLARIDVNEFVSYVMRDEDTGKPIIQAKTHRRMHAACSRYRRLVLWSHVEAGKTVQIAVARTLFILGRDPTARVVVISDTHEQAAKIVRQIAKIIEHSPEYHAVFPAVKRGEPWTSHHLYLRREDGTMLRDPAVVAVGLFGNISGSRTTHMIWDDILDTDNTATPAQRQKVYNWLKSAECMGRLLRNAPLWVIGNAYHPDDALHRLAREPNWHFMRLPVLDDRGRPTWPERWPLDRIEEKRLDVGPLEFARQMLCRARDDSEARFSRADLDACCARGRGLPWVRRAEDLCGTPWPLPMGAVTALPELPGGRVSHGVVGFDLDQPDDAAAVTTSPADQPLPGAGADVFETDDARALAARGRVRSPEHDSTTGAPLGQAQGAKRRGRSGQGQAHPVGAADRAAEVFPDSALTPAVPASVRPGELSGGAPEDAPAWLLDRQRRELSAHPPGGGGWDKGAPRGSVCAGVRSGRGLPPSNTAQAPQPSAHYAHPTTEGPTTERSEAPTDGREPEPPDVTDPEHHSVQTDGHAPQSVGDALQRGAITPADGQALARAAEAADRLGDPDPLGTAAEAGGSPTATDGPHTEPPNEAAAFLLGLQNREAPGDRNPDPDPPVDLHDHSLDSHPTEFPAWTHGGGGEARASTFKHAGASGERGGGTLIRVPGSPEGLTFAPDALGWLELWLAEPGTPHRNEQGWPIHPRTLVGLKRMGIEFETGVDLAVQKHSAADYTVVYTLAVYPPSGPHGHRLRRPVEILRGRWYAMDIAERIADARYRFGSIVTLENVAAQDYIRHILLDKYPDANEWLRGYTTGKQKADPEFGVEQLAAEFHREQWVFPVPIEWHPDREDVDDTLKPELVQNFNEILYFDPREHTGDVLMAQWLAKEGARIRERKREGSGKPIGVRVF